MKFSETQIQIAEETFKRNGFNLSQKGVKDAQAYLADNQTMYQIGAMSVSETQKYEEVDWAQMILSPKYFGVRPIQVNQGKPISDSFILDSLTKMMENILRQEHESGEPDYAFEAGQQENL